MRDADSSWPGFSLRLVHPVGSKVIWAPALRVCPGQGGEWGTRAGRETHVGPCGLQVHIDGLGKSVAGLLLSL